MAKKKTSSRKGGSTKAGKASSGKSAAAPGVASRKASSSRKGKASAATSRSAVSRKRTTTRRVASAKSASEKASISPPSRAKQAPKSEESRAADKVARGATRAASPEPALPKTRLTDEQLAVFKELLLDKRQELLGDVRTLTKDALGKSRQDSTGDLSSMPIHMADIGSDNWEQDFTLGLIANEQRLVREIDEALARIEDRTYGVCLATRRPISIARLRAKPWAKYCIEYARQQELGRY